MHRSISALAKAGLIARLKEARYDGYRLTYGGLDYLALHSYAGRGQVYSVGTRVGVGKESDILVVADDKGTQRILKIHRLGRISFRSVRSNRDYLRRQKHGHGGGGGWMYLSRLAAEKEYAFMRALRDEGFPVPEPLGQSRHTVLMQYVDGSPLRQVSEVPDPAALYADLISLILRLARHGLIHGDFNEFNILIQEERPQKPTPSTKGKEPDVSKTSDEEDENVTITPIVIDFPQMVSMDHQNAEMYFDRDVNCVKRFFERRFHFTSTQPGPFFKDAKKTVGRDGARRLDAAVEASGFSKKALKDLEAAIRDQQAERAEGGGGAGSESDDDAASFDEDDDEDEDEDEDDDEDEDENENKDTDIGQVEVGKQETDTARINIERLTIGNET